GLRQHGEPEGERRPGVLRRCDSLPDAGEGALRCLARPRRRYLHREEPQRGYGPRGARLPSRRGHAPGSGTLMAGSWGELENLTLTELELARCEPVGDERKTQRAYCPFHGSDRQRSLRVNRETGRFNCFACGAWGYLDDARERRRADGVGLRIGTHTRPPQRVYTPKPEPETKPRLAPLPPSYRAALPGSPGEAYLRERHIPLQLAQAVGVGFAAPGTWPGRDWHRGRVVFPHTTPSGDVVNLYGRAVGDAPKKLKHDHLKGAKGYFHAEALRAGDGPATICEGAFDALALMAAGAPN